MRIVFSRKGFDLGSGGCPSPILPDGRLLSLPIPDSGSGLHFGELNLDGINYGELIAQLTNGKLGAADCAHLDPDLNPTLMTRPAGWQPLFGQMKQAQGHLRNQGVGHGDLLLFFGLFQQVVETEQGWRFDRLQPRRHLLWGWMQIDRVIPVDPANTALITGELPWAAYHPHLVTPDVVNNCLYTATERLSLEGRETDLPGAGWFRSFQPQLQLSDPGSDRVSQWRLPGWFHNPAKPLSYLAAARRWCDAGDSLADEVLLDTAGRWQEAVLDTDYYPEAQAWALARIKRGYQQP